jgi:hypothetical protein
MNSKSTMPLISKKVMSINFICDFDMCPPFELFMPLKNTWLFHSFFPISLGEHCTSVTSILSHSFTQNLMLIHCSKNQSLIFVTRNWNTQCLISPTTSIQLVLRCWNCNWCKFKHAQTWPNYNKVACIPLSHAVKSLQELCSHTMYVHACVDVHTYGWMDGWI